MTGIQRLLTPPNNTFKYADLHISVHSWQAFVFSFAVVRVSQPRFDIPKGIRQGCPVIAIPLFVSKSASFLSYYQAHRYC